MLSIKNVEATLLQLPLAQPLYLKQQQRTQLIYLAITVHTHQGIDGFGFCHGFLSPDFKVEHLKVLLELTQQQLIPAIIDKNIDAVPAILLRQACANVSTQATFAISAIDIACWDIKAKHQNKSLSALLGKQTEVQLYGSGGWVDFSDQQLLTECESYYAQGVKAYKFKVGGQRDHERIQLLRQHMPDDFTLMVDANEKLSPAQALELSAVLKAQHILWLEEPLPRDQITASAALAKQSEVALAGGENLFYLNQFAEFCQQHAGTYLQPDVGRCCGITGFLNIAKLTEQYHLTLCTHLMTEISANVLPACKTGKWLEYMLLLPADLFVHPFSIQQGRYISSAPDAIGTGVYFKPEVFEKYKLV